MNSACDYSQMASGKVYLIEIETEWEQAFSEAEEEAEKGKGEVFPGAMP